MRVLICGDRKWGLVQDHNDPASIDLARKQLWVELQFVRSLPPDTVIIEGEADGADKHARIFGEMNGHQVERYPADWRRFGRAAGPIRNAQMLVQGEPTIVVAFHDDVNNSRGTKNMLKQARDAGIETKVITSE